MSTPVEIGEFSKGELLWALANVALTISNRETNGMAIVRRSLFKGILRVFLLGKGEFGQGLA